MDVFVCSHGVLVRFLEYRRELTYGLLNGMRRTYWIVADARQQSAYKKSASTSTTESTGSADLGFANRHVGDTAKEGQGRLVGWMVQTLLEDIKKIVSSPLAFRCVIFCRTTPKLALNALDPCPRPFRKQANENCPIILSS
jgi:hypothetical protein